VMTKTLRQRQLWDDDGRQEARERCATHPRQQSTHGDSWGGRRPTSFARNDHHGLLFTPNVNLQ
jgi:hypothetical protein